MLRVLFSLVCTAEDLIKPKTVCTAEDLIKPKTVAPMRNYCQYYYNHLFPVNNIFPFFFSKWASIAGNNAIATQQ